MKIYGRSSQLPECRQMDAQHEHTLVALGPFARPQVLEFQKIVPGLVHAHSVIAVKEAVEALLLVDEVADCAGIEHHEQKRLIPCR